eukprot:TRINITY_DN1317_c0_g3_i1.p1 TRINITY_DN1317_c0_g3~~TRINITY_DN1317_c0_g3_i1.p1  ORF type:complete len:275 (-),score=115.56 TRINITY_DN1317_c0_g3_i1:29-853(-)
MSLTEGLSNCALVGFSGFVGQNLLNQSTFQHFYNSKNIEEIKNKQFDIVVASCCPAQKWLANKEPEKDHQIIQGLINIFETVEVTKLFICISTIDVYKQSLNLDEDYDCSIDAENHHAYGRNRLYFENFVERKYNGKYLIVRLPALFGNFLKKNYIYDLLNNNGLQNINPNTKFQWYNLNNLTKDILIAINHNVKLINFFTEPILTQSIVENCFQDKQNQIQPFNLNGNLAIVYDLKTKYSNIFNNAPNGYIDSTQSVLNQLIEWVQIQKSNSN